MKLKILILASFLFQLIPTQKAHGQLNQIKAFEKLIGGSWINEGIQLGGHEGRNELQYEFALNGKIVKVKTYSTDPNTLIFELRNEGIRSWNASDSLIHFYEFDKHGGITTGIVHIEGKDFHYEYIYHGMSLRESWVNIDSNNYLFTIGTWENNDWKQVIHKAKYSRAE